MSCSELPGKLGLGLLSTILSLDNKDLAIMNVRMASA